MVSADSVSSAAVRGVKSAVGAFEDDDGSGRMDYLWMLSK